ncbi:hypothetical protein PQ648_27060, partial [Escherichia coli]|uniref:hypothetical protein n=1 Tax=Escherichia coli TaxID=562 RepID=UPI003B9B3C8F
MASRPATSVPPLFRLPELTLNQPRLVTDKNLVLSSSGQIVQNGGELTAGQNAMLSAQHLNQTSGTVNAAENVTLTTTND